MRKFKTAEDNRTNYIYYFNDGTSYTITPSENGENSTIISQLHGMDDDNFKIFTVVNETEADRIGQEIAEGYGSGYCLVEEVAE